MALTATQTQVVNLITGMFNAAPGKAIMESLAAQVDAGKSIDALAQELAASPVFTGLYPATQTAEEFAKAWVGNLFGGAVTDAASVTAAEAYIAGLINGGASRADAMKAGMDLLVSVDNADPIFGKASAQLENKMKAAANYSETESSNDLAALQGSIANVTDDVNTIPSVKDGTSFNLTNGVDNASANTFNALRVFNPDGSDQMNSLNDDDVLVGKGDDTTLNMTFVNDTETGDLNINPSMKNINNINVKFTADADQTLDLQDTTGVQNITAERIDNGADVTFDNIQSVLKKATVKNSNDNTGNDVTFDHSSSALSGNDTVDLSLQNVQMDDLRIDGVTQGYETINLDSSLENNTLNTLTIESNQTLNITGDKDLRLGGSENTFTNVTNNLVEASSLKAGLNNAAGSLTKVDASEFKGDLTYHIGSEINASADSSGNAISLEIIGGEGSDTFVLTNGNNINASASDTDTIDGGAGNNTLVITGGTTQSISTPAAGANLKNIQALQIKSGHDAGVAADAITVDADAFDALSSIYVRNEGQTTLAGRNIASTNENMTVTLNDLTVNQAKAITVAHGTTGNNGLANNVLITDLKANTTGDSLEVTLQDAVNTEARFNLAITDSTGSSYENVTIHDTDKEDNSVQLNSFANITKTLTVDGGEAGDFMNLDIAANGLGKVTTGASGDTTTVTAAAKGFFDQDAANSISNRDTAVDYALDTQAGGELLVADIAAGDYKGNLIARVGTADQKITLGAGDDVVIFADRAGITKSTAGLSISDTVKGGAGKDTMVFDGSGNVVLGASEWTNVSGIDALQIAGLAGSTARILVTDQLVDQTDGGSNITIINNDGDLTTAAEVAATIDLRQMSATNGVTFIGANEGGQGVISAVQTVIVDDVTANGASTLNGGDRNIISDYSATGRQNGAIALNQAAATANAGADLGALYGTQAAADADYLANVAAGQDGNNNVYAYHATTSTNEVTVGDLSGVSNFSTMTFDNDTALAQTYTVTLNDTVVDQLVDASHAANTTAVETLTLTANGSSTVALATGALALDASSLTSKFNLAITGGNGNDSIKLGAGDDTLVHGHSSSATALTIAAPGTIAVGDTITFGNGLDVVTGFNATAADTIDVVTPATVGTLTGQNEANLNELTTFVTSGTYNAATGAFVISASGAGPDTLIIENEGTNANDVLATADNAMVLVGVVETAVTALDFF